MRMPQKRWCHTQQWKHLPAACQLCLSVVTCNSNREQEFRIFAKWKCVCFAGQESKSTFWWVLSVRCQLQLTCHWPRGQWECVSCVYPGTTPNGHAKKSCTRQIDYAATETCAINLSAKGLPWLGLPCGAANQAKCCQVTNATEARYSAGLTQSFH